MPIILCRPRSLHPDRLETATRRALEINPNNQREQRRVERYLNKRRGGQRRIAVVIASKWPATGVRLSVQFLERRSTALRTRILAHMNAWSAQANVRFSETTDVGQVRIAFIEEPDDDAGYWSYVGTDILGADSSEPTLNLEGFTMRTSESEFRRVVRHEAGHTLGFEHEHMRRDLVKRIDPKKAYPYFRTTDGWSRPDVDEQVLTPLSERSLMGTRESDPLSIMCYEIPGSITRDGKPIVGGTDINPNDYAFAARLYPKTRLAVSASPSDGPTDAAPRETNTRDAPAAGPDARRAAADADAFHLVVMDEFDSSAGTAKGQRPKYARVFATYGGARVTHPMRLHSGKGEAHTAFPDIIRVHERIKTYTNREKGVLPDPVELQTFGEQLFETLFQGDVRRLYDEARARQQRRLDLVFTSMIPWIAEKPWEFAFDRNRNTFLATEDMHFLRNVLTGIPADAVPPVLGALRILVVAAQPLGFGYLSDAEEVAVIQRGFQELVDAGLVSIDVLAQATPERLHERLAAGSWQIVHFIGHGAFNEDTRQGELFFEDRNGRPYPLGERSIRELFCNRGLSLVFLNACQSGTGGRAEFNRGVAQSLVAHGLPAVVANQYSVLDASATSFARKFYWALARGIPIAAAAREARIAVNFSLEGEAIDWAVPVVYARDPGLVLSKGATLRPAAHPVRAEPAAAPDARMKSREISRISRVGSASTRPAGSACGAWVPGSARWTSC